MTGVAAGIGAYRTMIEGRTREATRVMTNTAILAGGYVGVRFACGISTVMAGCAIVHDALMVEDCRQEARGLMTLTAIRASGYMVEWFAQSRRTIVTGCTVVNDTRVVKTRSGKSRGVMAH